MPANRPITILCVTSYEKGQEFLRTCKSLGCTVLLLTVEDNGRVGGFGDAVARLLRDSDIDTPVRTFGLEQSFLEHGERAQVLETQGLTPQHLARRITEIVAQRAPELADEGQRA